jgi:hypothetical protein
MNKLLFEKLESYITFYALVILSVIFRTQEEWVFVLVTNIASMLAAFNIFYIDKKIKNIIILENNEKLE